MKLSSRACRLPLILATVLIVHSQASAQNEPIRVFVGNPDCSAFNVPAQGDVALPVWIESPYPMGEGSMRFFIDHPVVTEWLGVNFLYPWEYNYVINGTTLLLYFFADGTNPDTLLHLADLIFAIDAGPQYYGQTIPAISAGALAFSDSTGYILYPDSHCVSPLCIECQSSTNDPTALPEQISHSAYPNPFNANVAISLSLPHEGNMNLAIYDITGRRVKTLHDGAASGNLRVIWDGTGEGGAPVSSGVYFYRIEYENRIFASKVTLLR